MRDVTFGKYFCGNEISQYGQEHGFVDYGTLAKAFDAVLNNNIYGRYGYEEWETENGNLFYSYDAEGNCYDEDEASERIEELQEEMAELENQLGEDETKDEEIQNRIDEIQDDIEHLENYEYKEFYQYYIISSYGAEILSDYTNETVLYNAELDMYLWCVDHWGTSWDYVLTNIKCDPKEE